MRGRVVIVTGANSGVGKVTATELARRGARVVMACRSLERGEAALEDVLRDAGGGDVTLLPCDLGALASVRAFAEAFLGAFDRLDVLVNNAGAYLPERQETAEGLEASFGANHVGPFLLTALLLDRLRASAPARIVNVASDAHRWGRLDFDDLQWKRRPYRAMGAYAASKLANILHARELARRLAGTGVTANAVHPGVVGSQFGQGFPGLMRNLYAIARPLMLSPEKGARTQIHVATDPSLEAVTGRYFVRKRALPPSRRARSDEDAARLWRVSEELTGLTG